MGRELAAVGDIRAPSDEELEGSRTIARERAEQGLSVESVLHAHRVSVNVIWTRFGELAREREAHVSTVLAFSETLWRWADAVMDVVAASHREVELQLAREEQQRRDAFVLALLTGSSDAAELRRESATYGIDPEREYLPFRARAHDGDEGKALSHRTALALAGSDGLVTGLDGDAIGVTARKPVAIAGLTVGIGPALHARRAPRGVHPGDSRAPDRARIRPRGRALARRPLDPAGGAGRPGARRRVRRALSRAVGRDGSPRGRDRGDPARVARQRHADRRHREGAPRPPEHAAPPPAALRGGDRREPAQRDRGHGAVVGARTRAGSWARRGRNPGRRSATSVREEQRCGSA